MNETIVKELRFGETVSDSYGNRYTRTFNGWIFSNFAGHCCFVPEVTEAAENTSVTESTKSRRAKAEK